MVVWISGSGMHKNACWNLLVEASLGQL